MSKKEKIIFVTILIIGIFVRVYRLYDNPSGIHVDEAGMFVDANMLVKYGTDRYNNSYPIYFTNFGGGQSIMYGYLTAILIKIFGSFYELIRIPSVIFGTILIIISYLIGKQFLNTKKSLLLMSLVSFCPYFIQASRIGLDCNLLLPFFTISFYILIQAIKKQKNILFILTGILLGLSLYTYAISYIIIPCFIIISFIYLYKDKKINLKQISLTVIPLILIAAPLILFILVNYGYIKELKFFIFDINRIPNFRSSEINIKNIPDNIFMIINLLSYDFIDYNATKFFGTIYYISIPLFIIGLIKIIKNRKKTNLENLILINFITCYLSLLLISNININKANAIYFSIIYITTYGIINIESKKLQNIILILLSINFIIFNIYYIKNDTSNNIYFDRTIYKIINKKYDDIKDKNLIIITDTNEKDIFEKLGKINKIETTKKTENAYLIREKLYNEKKYNEKNIDKIYDYYLIY